MLEPSPGQGSLESEYGPMPGPGPVLILVVVAAICLVCSAVFLPWIRWGFSALGVGSTVSLWDLVSRGDEQEFGAAWMQPAAAGIAAAVAGSLFELFRRPVNRAPRWFALAGFVVVVGSACIGLFVGVSGFANPTALQQAPTDFSSTLGLGFWVALGIAVVGARRVPDPRGRTAEPGPPAGAVRPKPLGPTPGILPAGSTRPGLTGPSTSRAARFRQATFPPRTKPAVYPTPGYVTPAWTIPGNLSGLGLPFGQMTGRLACGLVRDGEPDEREPRRPDTSPWSRPAA